MTCLNHASFRLLAVARRGPCGPTRKLLDLAPHPVVGLSACEQFWYRQGCLLFDVVLSAFPLPTTASLTLQGALKDGLGEAVVA